ncbi:MAG: hypothetical protein QOJ62_2763, partial [Actinomycetota bacterium]|nr:hypothetical protein [Actinomycetota bacterium]
AHDLEVFTQREVLDDRNGVRDGLRGRDGEATSVVDKRAQQL